MTDKNPTCKCGHRRSEHVALRNRRVTTYTRCGVVTLAIACPCESFRPLKHDERGAVSSAVVICFIVFYLVCFLVAYVVLTDLGVH